MVEAGKKRHQSVNSKSITFVIQIHHKLYYIQAMHSRYAHHMPERFSKMPNEEVSSL
jgi:hypothetical protein